MEKEKVYTFRVLREETPYYSSRVTTLDDAAKFLRQVYNTLDGDREHFVVLVTDYKNQVIGMKVLGSGTYRSVAVSTRDVVLAVLRLDGSGFLVAHNHPTGDTTPSEQDRLLTRRLEQAATVLDLRFLDHVIVGDGHIRSIINGYVVNG